MAKQEVREHNACSCGRMVWCPDEYGCWWLDKYTTVRVVGFNRVCPDCNDRCMSKGAVEHKTTWGSVTYLPFKPGDIFDVLRQKSRATYFDEGHTADAMAYCMSIALNKEKTTMSLSDAVDDLLGTINGDLYDCVVYGDAEAVQSVNLWISDRYIKNSLWSWPTFCVRPLTIEEYDLASVVIHCTGTMQGGFTIYVEKNRRGPCKHYVCNTFKKGTPAMSNATQHAHSYQFGPDTDGCGKHYQYLHPDSAGYAECFRILREAKKDEVILNWEYNSRFPHFRVISENCLDGDVFQDRAGQKGDIGILREAADYVLGLRERDVPCPVTMSDYECLSKLSIAGYIIHRCSLYPSGRPGGMGPCIEANALYLGEQYVCSQAMDESPIAFLRRCVEHIRCEPQ